MDDLKSLFLLDPAVHFLNHGSFGATPRPVFAAYQAWQRRLERQPVQFLSVELPGLLAEARRALGAYVGAEADDLVYVPNATFGLNVVARSLALGPGDEVLTTDHEYGACHNVWQYLSGRRGFATVVQPLPLPVAPAMEMADRLWQGVTARTRVIFMSHITSATAVRLPVAEICRRAREAGILTVIDGAHAPGHIPLDLARLAPDFYFGNGHKWLCSPKGAAFLYARRERQPLIDPLVVGWGWGAERTITFGSDFLDGLQWLGTNDLSAYLSVPAAIEFQAAHDWPAVQRRCHRLLQDGLAQLAQLAPATAGDSPYPDAGAYYQMAVAPLPRLTDPAGFKARLHQDFRVEIPVVTWQGRHFLRLSIQAYNTAADVAALVTGAGRLLPRFLARPAG